MPASTPATNPSHVLPGEITGASLWRPTARPTKNAAVSATKTVKSTAMTAQKP